MSLVYGSINHFLTGSAKGSADFFTSIYQFLSASSTPETLNIKPVAFSTGSYPFGAGMDYSDTGLSSSNNAFAVFYWQSADTPFYVLIQYATSSTKSFPFGSGTGFPGTLNGNMSASAFGGVGIQIAAIPFEFNEFNQTPIWNGTFQNNGFDRKNATIVWATASKDAAPTEVTNTTVLPRSNDLSGAFKANKADCLCLIAQQDIASSSQQVMWHMFADLNNFMILKTHSTASPNYSAFYWGKYKDIVGNNPQIPYVMLWQTSSNNNPPWPMGVQHLFGSRAGSSSLEGGVPSPIPSDPGAKSVMLDSYAFITESKFNPSPWFASQSNSPVYDEYPIAIGMSEDPIWYGMLGQLRMTRLVWGLPTHTLLPSSSRAVFGDNQTGSLKLSIPWPTSSYVPGVGLSRSGTQFVLSASF